MGPLKQFGDRVQHAGDLTASNARGMKGVSLGGSQRAGKDARDQDECHQYPRCTNIPKARTCVLGVPAYRIKHAPATLDNSRDCNHADALYMGIIPRCTILYSQNVG